ncbi:aldo/keto reductase [Archangium lipolyticum]|uniref:aldo/keto reductase n=1 Tax=Archangium lipolyticum TaxID=2970465 RepID=UPI002149A98D|nr:aldo/keto reductase [Archangium lipolyticum]
MPLNHYVTLGRSGLRVSPLCLGAMTFGDDLGWGSSVQDSNAIMDRFLALGGNFIDTANAYTRGHSEKIIGDHIGRTPSRRDRVVIATKFFGNLFPEDPNGGGAGAKALIASTHESLRRLRTDYIDLLWMHAWDRHTPIEETMRALDDLVRAGKVRYIGFSDTPAWKTAQAQLVAQFRGWTPLVALQIEYSLLERTVEGELIPMAQELGLGVTPWSPLKSGVLSGKYTRENAGKVKAGRGAWVESNLNERAYSVIDVLQRVAKEVGATPAHVALAWVQNRPGVTSTIIGARTMEQLEANLGALDVKLSPAHVAALDEVSQPTLNFPAAFLQGSPTFMHGGLTVNGVSAPPLPWAPKSDAERY